MTSPTVRHASTTHHHHAFGNQQPTSHLDSGGAESYPEKRYESLRDLCPSYEITQRGRCSHLSLIYAFSGNLQKTTEILPAVIAEV